MSDERVGNTVLTPAELDRIETLLGLNERNSRLRDYLCQLCKYAIDDAMAGPRQRPSQDKRLSKELSAAAQSLADILAKINSDIYPNTAARSSIGFHLFLQDEKQWSQQAICELQNKITKLAQDAQKASELIPADRGGRKANFDSAVITAKLCTVFDAFMPGKIGLTWNDYRGCYGGSLVEIVSIVDQAMARALNIKPRGNAAIGKAVQRARKGRSPDQP